VICGFCKLKLENDDAERPDKIHLKTADNPTIRIKAGIVLLNPYSIGMKRMALTIFRSSGSLQGLVENNLLLDESEQIRVNLILVG
jgi:hypothetical protein